MRWLRVQERVAKWLSLLLCGYLLLGLAWVQVTQRVFRRQAEQLMRDVAILQPGQADWAEFQNLRTRWGAHALYEGQCTQEHCDYSIHLSVPLGYDWLEPEPKPWAQSIRRAVRAFSRPALIAARAHLPWVQAEIVIRGGRLKEEKVRFLLYVPKGSGPGWRDLAYPNMIPYSSGEYTLIAGYDIRSGHLDRDARIPIPEWPEVALHSESMIWRPSACTVCLEFMGVVTPYTPAAERSALTTINLDCLTGWTICVDEQRTMPGVFQRTMDDDRLQAAQMKRQSTCNYSSAERYAAADNVVMVRVVGQQPGLLQPVAKMKVLMRQKGGAALTLGSEYRLSETNAGMQRHPQDFVWGKTLLVMFPNQSPGRDANLLVAYQCGVLPVSSGSSPVAGPDFHKR